MWIHHEWINKLNLELHQDELETDRYVNFKKAIKFLFNMSAF